MVALSKVWTCGRLLARISGSNPIEVHKSASFESCVLSEVSASG